MRNESARPNDVPGSDVGGYTTEREQPAFGDPDLAASAQGDQPLEDAIIRDPNVAQLIRSDSTHTYVVSLIWGVLGNEPSNTPGIDGPGDPVLWTGHVTVNAGAVVLGSTIAFERNDRLIGRSDPTTIAWETQTTTSFDGIRFFVYQPYGGGHDTTADTLTVVAGENRYQFAVNDLAGLEETYSVQPEGNSVAIRSFFIDPRLSGHGFLGGQWLLNEDGNAGTFRGRWISRSGELAGFIRGHFDTRDDGRQVFFGKYIDRAGEFEGFLVGEWDRARDETPGRLPRSHGSFEGSWLDANHNTIGSLHGSWRAVRGTDNGFFEGAWGTTIRPHR